MSIGSRMRERRKELGISRIELADADHGTFHGRKEKAAVADPPTSPRSIIVRRSN